MKIIISAFILMGLVGCTTMYKGDAAPQSYRLKGEDKAIDITGKLDAKVVQGVLTTTLDANLKINIDGDLYITGKLDDNFSGEFQGREYQGKKTSTSCTGKVVGVDAVEVRCIVFIDNERTVTLTF